jgi:hypothetical protein
MIDFLDASGVSVSRRMTSVSKAGEPSREKPDFVLMLSC